MKGYLRRIGARAMIKAVRYFSKLGNTKTIAEAIAEGAGVPAVSITSKEGLARLRNLERRKCSDIQICC